MSIKDNLTDFWETVKESYYDLEEKIGFPPILLLLALLVVVLLYFLFFVPKEPIQPKEVELTVFFKDEEGNALPDLEVNVSVDGNIIKKFTNSRGAVVIEVKPNSEIVVSVDSANYESISKTFFIGENNRTETITLKLKTKPLEKRTLRFEDEKGLIKGKKIRAKISCANKAIPPWYEEDTDMDGIIEVTLPLNCGEISVDAEIEGYERQEAAHMKGSEILLFFKKIEPPKGNLRIRVVDEEQNLILNKNIKVSIEKDGERDYKFTQGYGIVDFKNLLVGTYNIYVSDPSGDYAASRMVAEVIAKQTVEVTIEMKKAIKAVLKVKVIDRNTGVAIEGATVKLMENYETVDERTTSENGLVEFAIFDLKDYSVIAKKEGGIGTGYFAKSVDVNAADLNSLITIELEKITQENSGKTIVKVIDEDGRPVKDAKVMFRYKETEAIVELNSEQNYKLTDANGTAIFYLGTIEEEIYPYAIKYPATGGSASQAKRIDPYEENHFEVLMHIGESTLNIKALKTDGTLLEESYFEVFSATDGSSISNGKIPMVDGTYSYSIKADKKIYVVVSKEGYLSYESEEIALWPGQSYEINAIMRKVGEVREPLIEFLGAFKGDVKEEALRANNEYEFKFNLVFPDNNDLDKAGFHFRVGDNNSVELEPMFIKDVKTTADVIIKGKTYRPKKGQALEELTESDAKWVTLEWIKPKSGTYKVSVVVKIRQAVFPKTKLSFYYRSYSVKGSRYIRSPVDAELGEQENTQSKDALYAECFSATYFEGSEPLCSEAFCYKGDWLYDKQEDIFLEKPYSLTVLGDYNFLFSIMNNSVNEYNEVRLVVKNVTNKKKDNALDFEKVIFEGPAKQTTELIPENSEFTIENIEGFTYTKEISANIRFKAKKETTTGIEIQLIADKQVVFSKEVEFIVYSNELLNVKIEPERFIPFKKHTLKATVEDSQGNKISDALVRVIRETPDNVKQVMHAFTDSEGFVEFEIPESYPGTRLTIEVEKIGYAPVSVERFVDSNIALVMPRAIFSSLNTTSKTDESLPLSIENLTGTALIIKEINLKGNFKGLLNEEAMQAYANTNAGLQVDSNESLDIVIKTVLAFNAASLLESNESLSGNVEIVLYNPLYNFEYAVLVPLTVDIGLGGLPDNAPCIVLSGPDIPEWSVTTLDNIARTEFEISNLCMKNGQKIDLENLQVKLEWQSDSKKAGVLELTIIAPDGSSVSQVLKSGQWVKFLDNFKQADYGGYQAILTFTPKTGYMGETAKFTIYIDGQTRTDAGLKFVGADNTINGNILILNLEDCIKYPKEKIELSPEQDEATFSLDASACGIDVYITLCMGDPRCTGGTTEGGITLMPHDEIGLTQADPEETITVYREDIPGIYGITLYARTPQTSYRKIDTIDVLVRPETNSYFELKRYEFNLSKEANWQDSTELKNKMLLENVLITSTLCTNCKNTKKLPDYCILNKALEQGVGPKGIDPNTIALAATTGITVYKGVYDVTFKLLQDIAAQQAKAAAANAAAASSAAGSQTAVTAAQSASICGPPCVATITAIVVTAIIVYVILNAAPACDTTQATYPFQDYVIYLPDDLKNLELKYAPFLVKLGSGEESVTYSDNSQTIPIEFKNNTQEESIDPTYGILEVKATEHIHGDPLHQQAKMSRDKADFSNFNIPDTETRNYTQKFHLKFDTKQVLDIEMPELGEEYSCVSGTRIGVTGEKALPKIKFDWSWDAIEWNSCDADNENAIYCDATQFSIALSKRLHMLDDLFRVNNYIFECPTNPITDTLTKFIENFNANNSTHEVETGKVGVSKIESVLSENEGKVTIKVTVENKTAEKQTAKIRVVLKRGESYAEECYKEITIEANSEEIAECTFENLEKSDNEAYVSTATITESSASSVDASSVGLAFILSEAQPGTCWLPYSTRKIEGRPAIIYFFDRSIPNWQDYVNVEEIKWPEYWPGETVQEKIDFLNKLIEFRALLIKDGYSADFQKDFAEYYSEQTFFEVPSWFMGEDGLYAYFSNPEHLSFKDRHTDDKILTGPGTYNVFLQIDFNNNLDFFEEGKPNAKIEVLFSKVAEPYPNSVFYYWPIDGFVGLESEDGRQGYGANYINQSDALTIALNPNTIKTKTMNEANPIITITTSKEQDLAYIDASPATRGNLLEFELSGKNAVLNFSPNIATPVIMKVSGEKGKSIKAEYALLERDTPIAPTSSLGYWNGLGECLDFSGAPVLEAFSYYPDSKVSENTYGLRWDPANYTGDVYLYSLLFTPAESTYILKSFSPNVKFITPNSNESSTVQLDGIAAENINSISDILELVKQKKVCVTSSGSKTMFWWNPKWLLETKGSVLSIEEFEKGLSEGKCISYGS